MTLAALGIGYLALGFALAIGFAIVRRLPTLDCALVVVMWPIWVPLVLSQAPAPPLEQDVRARARYLVDQLAELDQRRREFREELASIESLLARHAPEYPARPER